MALTEGSVLCEVFAGPDARRPVDLRRWQRLETGSGRVETAETGLRLATADTTERCYTDAQIDDTQGRARRDFLWRPPLALTVRARFSHEASREVGDGGLRGTAGFGFWNDPFLMSGWRVPALPRAIWFFYASPPSDIPLDPLVPGYGWKAATIDALRPGAAALALTAPLSVPLMNIGRVYRALWPRAQRVLGIREAQVPAAMTGWHTYTITWETGRASFEVDGRIFLESAAAPRGPLGLVIWLDNQYLVATPWGRLRYGLLARPGEQWLELERVEIRTGDFSPGLGRPAHPQ
jgi:hypothetical protein